MATLAATGKRLIHRSIAHLVATILRGGAIYDPVNFRLWERSGFHVTPLHFYHPIPDTRELADLYPPTSALPGIDLRLASQLALLADAFPRFGAEYNALPHVRQQAGQFFLENDAFRGIDPLIYYCMIRHFLPQTIIEIGSGFSTLLAAQAAAQNGATTVRCIDPWPRDFIALGHERIDHVPLKVEDLGVDYFRQLRANDILFIDSSHVVRTGGDVGFLFLEVLPRLAHGVIVHIHDIYLPFDYPAELLLERHLFWTEQYLLQAYLAENVHAEVLMANNYLAQSHPEALRKAYPAATEWGGGSFWFRKC